MDDSSTQYKVFDKQVAGHRSTVKELPCMIMDGYGYLLKYLKKSRKGEIERNTYETVFSDVTFLSLRKFLPRYFGTVKLEKSNTVEEYLKIENILFDLDYPNIVDIKIGRVTYDPFANQDKILRESNKYPAQKEIGFRLSGMQICNNKMNQINNYGGDLFRNCLCFTSPQMKTQAFLKQFFSLNSCLKIMNNEDELETCKECIYKKRLVTSHFLDHLIDDLVQLKDWIQQERRIKFYASSLLLAYDSAVLNSVRLCTKHIEKANVSAKADISVRNIEHNCFDEITLSDLEGNTGFNVKNCIKKSQAQMGHKISKTIISKCENLHVPYQMKMIDFAHTYIDFEHTNIDSILPSGIDTNYLFGIKNLLSHLKTIFEEI